MDNHAQKVVKGLQAINLNDNVKVKLTAFGIKIYIDYMNAPNNGQLDNPIIKPMDCMPKIDEEGYTIFQLWQLFSIFGKYINMGTEMCFFPLEIVIA